MTTGRKQNILLSLSYDETLPNYYLESAGFAEPRFAHRNLEFFGHRCVTRIPCISHFLLFGDAGNENIENSIELSDDQQFKFV